MIIVSDTPSAVLLQDTLGGQTADATLRSLGIEDTSFNNRSLPATAADMSTLMEAVAAGAGVSGESKLRMLQLLLQEGYKDGVAAGLPEGTAIAHKTGSYSDATHDVAVVWGPGGPYIISVMSDQPNNWPLIAEVSGCLGLFRSESVTPGVGVVSNHPAGGVRGET
jgi:beta-lactamase class A